MAERSRLSLNTVGRIHEGLGEDENSLEYHCIALDIKRFW